MASFRLRTVNAEDSEELFRIHRESMTEYLEQAFEGWTEERAREHHQRWMTSGTTQVILVDEQIGGSLEVVPRDGELWIVRIEIDPRFQNQGLGSAILKQVQRQAAEQLMPLVLEVFVHNPARRLYERLGFRAVSRDGPSVKMKWDGEAAVDQR
jgi:ribosomal protein S18 acetylase RimI-like enzyme